MARHLSEKELVVASHNPGKLREILDLLAPFKIVLRSAIQLGLREAEETGQTFAENAKIKALSAAIESQLPSLAADSGLSVLALGGAPGIYSARWGGPERNFTVAMERVWMELGGDATDAQFVCALCLAWPDGHTEIFEGTVSGHITWPGRGLRGFGYDPIFVPEGHKRTFGEMDPKKKHAMSHRANAFSKLVAACLEGKK